MASVAESLRARLGGLVRRAFPKVEDVLRGARVSEAAFAPHAGQTQANRTQIMHALSNALARPDFFAGLEKLPNPYGRKNQVAVYLHEDGTELIVKSCGSPEHSARQGGDVEGYDAYMQAFAQALDDNQQAWDRRKPQSQRKLYQRHFGPRRHYHVVPIRALGTIDANTADGKRRFLVMERLKTMYSLDKPIYPHGAGEPPSVRWRHKASLTRAYRQLLEDVLINFNVWSKYNQRFTSSPMRQPQVDKDILVLGRARDGKWVFALPRDVA